MGDENPNVTQEPAGQTPPPCEMPSTEGAMAAQEVADGKAFAVLSYVLSLIGLPFFLVPLIMRNNAFSLYHAKQCLMLWLVGIVGGILSAVLAVICVGVILGLLLAIFGLVLTIMGIINAANGVVKPLPVIGRWGEDWFKGIVKV